MALSWASQESFSDCEVVGRVVAHVLYTNYFEAAPVRPENIIASRVEDGTLSNLCPSIQIPKQAALSEVSDQVNKTKICK